MDQQVARTGGTSGRADAPRRLVQEIEELFQDFSEPLFAYALSFGRDSCVAQDAVQESFLRYFLVRRRGEPVHNPRAWLARVLRNYLIDESRRDARKAELHLGAGRMDPGPDPYSRARHEEVRGALRLALSPREWECLELRASGMKLKEIASAMGLRPGTVGVLLGRAARKVLRLLHESTAVRTGGDWKRDARNNAATGS